MTPMTGSGGRRTNVEFKARTDRHESTRKQLSVLQARSLGRDSQVDTYFNTARGRLKLREGTIETSLIYYERSDEADVRRSDVRLYLPADPGSLKALLTAVHGVDVVVEKERDIFFVGNVKIHLDVVAGLGSFVEVEAIDEDGTRPIEELYEQCRYFQNLFGVDPAAVLGCSYSDLIRARRDSAH